MLKIFWIYLFFLSFIFALETNFSAEARLRIENFHDDESSTSATASYFRSRLSADLKKSIYNLHFQLQDSRLLGYKFSSLNSNQNILDLHQVYANINGPFNGRNKIRIGRFEMPLGKQRLFGRSNWSNFGKSFEGIILRRNTKKGNIKFFHLINGDLYPLDDQFDYKINGVYGATRFSFNKSKLKQKIDSNKLLNDNPLQLDYYFFSENIVLTPKENIQQRQTLGFRLEKGFSTFVIESELATQYGVYYSDKIDAHLASINLRIPINKGPIRFVAFSKEYISGDEYHLGGSDGVLSGFAKPFGSSHLYHGYYDNPLHTKFSDNTHQGLNEWYIKADLLLPFKIDFIIKYHDFKDAVDINRYGSELDFVFSKKLLLGGEIIQGVSIYFPDQGERFEAAYLMILVNI
tara:strand:- start:2018 stop:3232 length:1215 start_codon:yes stop_codon:yes gene_type:complete